MIQKRIDHVCEKLREQNLAGILICPSEEMRFLTGFTPMMCERFQGLFLTSEGKSFYVCNILYLGEIDQSFQGKMKLYHWMDGHSMTDVVRGALEDHGLTGKTLAANSTAQAFNVLDIIRDCGVDFVNGKSVLEEARIIKTEQEIDSLRRAARIADQTYAKAIQWIKPGMSEENVLQFLKKEMGAAGGQGTWGIVASGPNSSFPHYHDTRRVIQEKDLLILDFGCTVDGLYSDMSRTVFIGEPTEEERKVYELVLAANLAGEKAAVKGAYIPDVDAAARDLIANAGYGDTFITRLGHGIGYMMHEAPDIKRNNQRRLQPGMAFSIEPGVYLNGRFGVRIEDIVLVTQTGNEVLNQVTKELVIID